MIKAPDGSLFEITAIQKLSPRAGKVSQRKRKRERGYYAAEKRCVPGVAHGCQPMYSPL